VTLIDTDILIDAGREISAAIDCRDRLRTGPGAAVSVVTQMEMMVGCRDKAELRNLVRFMSRFQEVDLDPYISGRAVEVLRLYHLSHGLLIADALIAVTALVLNMPFISKNQRDFRFIADLTLVPYP
jgi:predicted nucleic acid-binding protein